MKIRPTTDNRQSHKKRETTMGPSLILYLWLALVPAIAFHPISRRFRNGDVTLKMAAFGRSNASKIPTSPSERDNLAIDSIKAAIDRPKTPSFPLIECEFPPLESLNKLGDGSLRSANQVDDANLEFCAKLVRSLSPLPFMGPKTRLLTNTSATGKFMAKAKKVAKSATSIHSLRDGIPDEIQAGDVCILVSPSSRQDYQAAQQIASSGVAKAIVVVNCFAKDPKSVGESATMAYFLKPLTYNSQVVGYLARSYPSDWATIDAISKQVLKTYTDAEILVRETNTPDLRESGKLVQKSVDERAIKARKNQ